MTLAQALAHYADATVSSAWSTFSDWRHYLSLQPMLVALAIAAVAVALGKAQTPRSQGQSLFARLLPREIWTHRSTRHDLAIILINEGALFFLPALAGLVTVRYAGFLDAGASAGSAFALESRSAPIVAIFSLYSLLLWDFAATFAHYLKHRVAFLWEFHKVHHCAPVMPSLTALRRHPAEALISALISGTIIATGGALWLLVAGSPGSAWQVGGVALGLYLWRLVGYNIRHSHIFLSYGPVLNTLLISPAHHQIHHSDDPRHHGRNFGHIFTFWDRLFGTLHHPDPTETIRFGIEEEDTRELDSLAALDFVPLRRAFAPLFARLPQRRPHQA